MAWQERRQRTWQNDAAVSTYPRLIGTLMLADGWQWCVSTSQRTPQIHAYVVSERASDTSIYRPCLCLSSRSLRAGGRHTGTVKSSGIIDNCMLLSCAVFLRGALDTNRVSCDARATSAGAAVEAKLRRQPDTIDYIVAVRPPENKQVRWKISSENACCPICSVTFAAMFLSNNLAVRSSAR